jgi:hypothetical protein
MRRVLIVGLITLLCTGFAGRADDAKTAARDTPAADRTRTKLLRVKVSVAFQNVTLRDALKEFAAQVDMAAERPVMWTYGPEVPANTTVTYSCRDKPLEQALDELFKAHGLGYVVVSKEDDRRNGWVRVTTGTERGYAKGAKPAAGAGVSDDEKLAAGKLAFAKELLDAGKAASAKPVLVLITRKYAGTKAAAEAKGLLEKLDQ